MGLADSLNAAMDFRFTRTAEPVYINFKAEDSFMLFVLATHSTRVAGSDERGPPIRPQTRQQNGNTSQQLGRRLALGVAPAQKRRAEEQYAHENRAEGETSTPEVEVNRPKAGGARPNRIESSRSPTEMPYASASSRAALTGTGGNGFEHNSFDMLPPPSQSQPLFLASQVSQRDLEIIREAGLGIEDMDADQLAEMLNEGEDFNLEETSPQAESTTIMKKPKENVTSDDNVDFCGVSDEDFDLCDVDFDMGPTQRGTTFQRAHNKVYPLPIRIALLLMNTFYSLFIVNTVL